MDPFGDTDVLSIMPWYMTAFFVLFGVIFVGVVVFIVIAITRNAKAARAAGYDPLTMQTQLVANAMNSELLKPPAPAAQDWASGSLEARLAELDELHARGVISDAEHAAARAAALGG